MKENLYFAPGASSRMMDGIKKIANAVGPTMGTAGNNVLIEALESPGHYATNDGYSIANSIYLENELENMGRGILLEAINRANKASGDGSSTTCVLTAKILEEGQKYQSENPMEIKRSLEACLPIIEQSLLAQKKDVSIDDVEKVASISAEDPAIGKTIQEIYQKIGKDGIIYWDASKTNEDSYSIGAGITINGATYVSPYMCDMDSTGRSTGTVQWKNPKVLLCNFKITSSLDFETLFSSMYAKNMREVIVFCDDIEVPVISDLVKTRMLRGFKTAVVKMPVLWKDEWWEDVAATSGATIIDPTNGKRLQDATIDDVGEYGNILVTKENTHIDGIKDITIHLANLQSIGDEKSLNRIARLNVKTARYFVGANSETALAYKRLKVEDAINAASVALEHGIVVGGGMALYNATKDLPIDTIGGKILAEALRSPANQIIANARQKIQEHEVGGEIGFNSQTNQIENLVEKGIVDPYDVVYTAIKNAIGVAATVLTTGAIVLLPREDKPEIQP